VPYLQLKPFVWYISSGHHVMCFNSVMLSG
jgi:hypothetical protein